MKRAIRIIAIVVGILIVIAIALPFLVDVNSFRPKLESELTSALGRQVKVGNLSLSIFSGTVSADNISIADDPAFSKNPFVTAKSLKAGVEVMPLVFSKTLHITAITLDEPQITLLKAASGKWNFSSIGGTAPQATAGARAGTSIPRLCSRASLPAVPCPWISCTSRTAVCWWERPTRRRSPMCTTRSILKSPTSRLPRSLPSR